MAPRRAGKRSSRRGAEPGLIMRIEERDTVDIDDATQQVIAARSLKVAFGMSVLAGGSLAVVLTSLVGLVVSLPGWGFHPLVLVFFLAAAAGVFVLGRGVLQRSYPRKRLFLILGAGAVIGALSVGYLV